MANFYLDVETCPIDREQYEALDETERKKLINPIDSSIVAIGIKRDGHEIVILRDEDEAKMLREFWEAVAAFRKTAGTSRIVGFNIKDFDLPVLVTRSFINNVKIVPFNLKEVVDLREKLSAYKYGNVRGKLKEFAELIGMEILEDVDGSKVAELCWKGEWDKITAYLRRDIEITEAIHKRTVELRINEIERW